MNQSQCSQSQPDIRPNEENQVPKYGKFFSTAAPVSTNCNSMKFCSPKCKFYHDDKHPEQDHWFRDECGGPSQSLSFKGEDECNNSFIKEKSFDKILKVSSSFQGRPIPTNNWHSSLAWKLGLGEDPEVKTDPESNPLVALPISYKTTNQGIVFAYNENPTVSARNYDYGFHEELLVGATDDSKTMLAVANSVLDNHSDWVVTAKSMDAQNKELLKST